MSPYREYLKDDLARVLHQIDTVFQVEGTLMREVATYVRTSRGKMLRPAMVCLAARAFGYEGEFSASLGAAVELFHVATLLHDDVIDTASLRRGRATVNAKWGNDVAILFADYLYASCFDHALSCLRPEVVQVLTKTTQKMTEGEMYQIEKRADWLTVDDYFSIIRSKTACLFSACAGLGAIIAQAPPEKAQRLFEFGLAFGMAFQITDDALDYEAQGDAWGKRVGADLKEGKQTLPLLHTLQTATPEDRAALVQVLQNGRDFDTVHGFVRRYQGIDFSLDKAAEYTRNALEILDEMPDNRAIAILRQITDGVLVRQS